MTIVNALSMILLAAVYLDGTSMAGLENDSRLG